MSGLAERIASLSPAQRAALEGRLAQRRGERPITRRPGAREVFPASSGQERLWFLERLDPGSPAYVLLQGFRLRGPLDRPALGRALVEIVRRHDVLRTTFAMEGARLVQRVGARAAAALPLVDLRRLARPVREAEVRRIGREQARRGFDLGRGPLLRAVLLWLDGGEHAVSIAMHHIVSDGWSQGVVAGEVSALYAAFAAGRPSPLAELPVQYGDFAAWQRERLAGPQLAVHLAFWEERLRGPLPVLELPGDRPRPKVLSARGAARPLAVPAAVAGALRRVARGGAASAVEAGDRAPGATLFMLLLGAFETLLARWTGETDLLVGTPVANRTDEAVAGLIGFFVNTLVLRGDLADDPEFRRLLARTRAEVLAAQAHQDLPFEKLVERLQPGRDLGHRPLFQVMLVLQNMQQARPALPGLEVSALPLEVSRAQCDLSLVLWPEDEGLGGRLEYSADLFDSPTVGRMAVQLEALLASIAADPGRRLSALSLLAAAERAQLLREWNDTDWQEPDAAPVHEQFAAQARRTPERTALVDGTRRLDYRELDALTVRLARRLRRRGVGPEVLVGVHLERSLELVVTLLAVLRAGGAYLPLDPDYPAERLGFMLGNARAPLVVARREHAERLAAAGDHGKAMLWLDREWEALPGESAEPFASGALPESLAYVIYTSGSTGRPKGAMNSHGALRNRLAWMQAALGLEAGDRVLQKTPFSFDVSVWELFWPLMTGACLVVARPAGHLDPAYLAETMAEHGITTVHFVPSMLRLFLGRAEAARLPRLRHVVCSGEELPPDLAAAARARLPRGCRLYNLYGATEAAIDSTCWTCGEEQAARVPIGRPFANQRLHVLDRAMGLAPIGAIGEAYLGGTGLARGYVGRPDLTAERFVPDPEGGGGRLYRTGDLARHLADGRVDFLGRVDRQVKIHGFRIELGEIETALAAHPAVRECAVAVRPLAGGDPGLVAYLVCRAAPPDPVELRAFLGRRLPEPMVPGRFVPLPELPLSPNGKLDRRALPSPAAGPGEAEAAFVAPAGPLEEAVADMWAEVLGRPSIGAHDDFFALGGHSLLALQVFSRLRALARIELPVRTIFEAPTVRRLAAALAAAMQGEARAWTGPRPGARGPRPLLSHAQERLWFLDQLLPGSSAYNLAVPLRVAGPFDERLAARALAEVVRRHEILRTRFPHALGRPFQEVVPADAALAAPLLRRVDLTGLPQPRRQAAAARAAACLARRPFDLAGGPVFAAALFRLAAEDRLLLAATHHIVFDGSFELFVRELGTLYAALASGRPPALPGLPIQFADFAAWQRRWLEGGVIAEQLAWWRRQLAGERPPLTLPTDRPRPAVQSLRGDLLRFELDEAAGRALRSLGQAHGATTFMVGLAAFAALLHRYGGQPEVLVGTPIADRPCAEAESLIGCFVNTLVMRADLRGDPGFVALTGRIREATLGAYLHKDLPFEVLVDDLQPRRDLSQPPLFQVMFTLLNAARARLPRLPGLRLEVPALASGASRFDLLFALAESSGGSVDGAGGSADGAGGGADTPGAGGAAGGWTGWGGRIEYSTDLFDAATIRRAAGHFQALLAAAADQPDRSLSELPLLSPGERHQLSREWNDTAAGHRLPGGDGLPAAGVHELFERQARRTPQAVAAIAAGAGEPLTYAELDRRADRLAGRLARLGVATGVTVGVHLERSPAMLVALLAILKAGGAYVPVGTSLPVERIAVMLRLAGVRCLVTQRDRLDALGAAAAGLRQVVLLGADGVPLPAGAVGSAPGPAAEPALEPAVEPAAGPALEPAAEPPPGPGRDAAGELPARRTAPGDPAYVIFTSGSTGQPKGVVVCHGAVLNLLAWVAGSFGIGPRDRVLFTNSLGFDLSVYDVFGLLAAGGSVRVASDAELAEPARLWQLLADGGITFWDSAPAALEQVLALAPAGAVPPAADLRLVFLSGDWVPLGLPDLVRRHFPAARVVALGGATEATVWSNSFAVAEVPPHWTSIPYGRPMLNAAYHVLDQALAPCPIGVAGDLSIGGDCLATGYAGEPRLTAERFLPDPFSSRPGARLYRTGDRARLWADGTIEFLGRLDDQVKIRGFRIELGEIEAVLEQHPAVGRAVVVALGGRHEKSLVAYLVPAAGAAPEDGELRDLLGRQLPRHMMPAAFVTLAALPLTANGKVDRRALPAPRRGDERAREQAPPRTTTEQLLAGIWTQLLGLPRVARHDDFFALGGHSLLASQLIARVRETFALDLPLQTVFEMPALASLAARIDTARGSHRAAPPLRRRARRPGDPVPASYAQRRLWLEQRLSPGDAAYNIPAAVRLAGRLDAAVLRRCLTAVAARHEALRTVFADRDGEALQVVTPPAEVALPLVDLGRLGAARREAEAAALAERQRTRPFDVERGPLLRACLLRLAGGPDGDHLLLVAMHHLVADGWSLGILVRELGTLYGAGVEGRPLRLEELPVQYADYALWQREWLRDEALEEHVSWWQRRLAGGPARLALPGVRPLGARRRGDVAVERFALPRELTARLEELARSAGATLFIALLALWKALLSRVCGEEDVAVAVPVAGRDRLELEPLIGLLVNTLVLRTGLAGDPSFRTLLGRVRDTLLGAHAYQDVPFDELVPRLRLRRSGGRALPYQVSFRFQAFPEIPLSLPGLALRAVDLPSAGMHSELDLEMSPGADGLRAALRYSPAAFAPAAVAALAAQYLDLAGQAAARPDDPLSALHPAVDPRSRPAPVETTAFNDDLLGE